MKIALLSQLFQFDYTNFISTNLNESNLIEHQPLVSEILLETSNSKHWLEENCDKIVNLCLLKLFESQNDNALLKYIEIAAPNCTSSMHDQLVQVFVYYFNKAIQSNDHFNINYLSMESSNKYFKSHLASFGPKQISFLTSLLNYLKFEANKTVEYLIDVCLQVLGESDENDQHISKLCISTLSKLANSNQIIKSQILDAFFRQLKQSFSVQQSSEKKRLESFRQDTNLSLLTSLADYLLPLNNDTNTGMSYLRGNEYWKLIQSGLMHSNSLTRKRALYLLKRTTDYAWHHKQEVQTSEYCVVYNQTSRVYLYDARLMQVWNDFFVCIEIMEETSVHIIKPALSVASQLIESVLNAGLHYSWIIALFTRAFLHESKYVVRWAVQEFCRSNLHTLIKEPRADDSALVDLVADVSQFIYGPLMLTLQKSYLFYKTEDNDLLENNFPPIGQDLSDFFTSFVAWLPSGVQMKFLEQFTQQICQYSWSSISLLFVCIAFKNSNVNSMHLSAQCTRNISQILQCSLTTHEVFMRSSIQTFLLQSLLKHTKSNVDVENLNNFLDVLNFFSIKECLQYDNSSWKLVINWFKQLDNLTLAKFLDSEFNKFMEVELNNDYLLQIKSTKLAKLILIVSEVLDQVQLKPIDYLVDKLKNCSRNLYMNTERVEKCLLMFNFLTNFVSKSDLTSFKLVKKVYEECSHSVLDYLMRRIDEVNLFFNKLNIYFELLSNMLEFDSDLVKPKIVKQYLPAIEAGFRAPSGEFSSEWKRFALVNILSILIRSNLNGDLEQFMLKNTNLISSLKVLSRTELAKLKFVDASELIVNDLQKEYSVYNGQYIEHIWLCLDYLLLKQNATLDLREQYADSLEKTSPYSLASLIKCASNFINETNLVQLFDSIQLHMWDLKDDVRNFNDSYLEFLECFVTKKVFLLNSEYMIRTVLELVKRTPEKNCLIRPLVDKMLQMMQDLTSLQSESLIDVLIRFLTFGDVYKKDRKNLKDVEVYIESLGEQFGTNQIMRADYLYDISVRILALNYLLTSPGLTSQFYSNFLRKLLLKDSQICEENQRMFINSLAHRERFRLWQVVLCMLPKLAKSDQDLLMRQAEQYLINENQPSMRIIIEWVVIRIITSQIETFDLYSLFSKLDNFIEKRIGYACSWLTIMTHLVASIKDIKRKCDYFVDLIPIILSQVLSANFHVRTYVEAILIKLYSIMTLHNSDFSENPGFRSSEFLNDNRVKSVLKQIYSIVHKIIDDKERHAMMLLKHFYFQFNPMEDYTIETIFDIFPRMSGIIEDELVTVESFMSIVLNKSIFNLNEKDYEQSKLPVGLSNSNEKLDDCTPGVWRFVAYKDDIKPGEQLTIEDLQKKIIPWQNLIPVHEDLKQSTSELILVASLIDKQTNLGGICRTCEIFSVKELVIGSLRYLDDKQFQSLSVTAEKWLNIKEVAIRYLKKYLYDMKLQGYMLIGLEQTAKSVQLDKFSFPAKSLILLGNEKEGIPVDLIQMLDVCVEIPQLGVIRSLNVHVSCAISIWEYAKQNLIIN